MLVVASAPPAWAASVDVADAEVVTAPSALRVVVRLWNLDRQDPR